MPIDPISIRRPAVASYDPDPSEDQRYRREVFQQAVGAVAAADARETQARLRRQELARRHDASVLIFGDDPTAWEAVSVVPKKRDPREDQNATAIALGFEPDPNSSRPNGKRQSPPPAADAENPEDDDYDDYDPYGGVDIHGHGAATHAYHEELYAQVQALKRINAEHARKSPRPVQTHAAAHKQRDAALATPLDKRVDQLSHACESCFNEEMKMQSHPDFIEHCSWLHRRATQHTAKQYVSAVATLNQNGSDAEDQRRMIEMLKHQSELGELYLTCIVLRDCSEMVDKMGVTKRTGVPHRAKKLMKTSHEVHRILVSAPGSSKLMKLREAVRQFAKELLHFRDAFNEWNGKQVIQFSRLTKSISLNGVMPFTTVPTPAQIKAAEEHAAAERERKKKEVQHLYKMKLSRTGGAADSEAGDSVSSIGGDSLISGSGASSRDGSESAGSARSKARLQAEIRRATHETPFIAGGKIMYAPRRPHTRGSRALTGMELDVIPLVTGARDSVEHATSLSSPRRKPHPSWEPHVELTAHPTFGKKYHGHHLHVHHHDHGHDWEDKVKEGHAKHHGHQHHHHHHHHQGNGQRRPGGRPKTLRECILSHETDVQVLAEAYRAEQLKFPPSWKADADAGAKAAQQVQILRDEESIKKKHKKAHGAHHNVYEMEAHGKPPSGHRELQNMVKQAGKSMQNKQLQHFSLQSYRKVLAVTIQQGQEKQAQAQIDLKHACEAETGRQGRLLAAAARAKGRAEAQAKERDREHREFLATKRPKTTFSKPLAMPGFTRKQMDAVEQQKKADALAARVEAAMTGGAHRSTASRSASARGLARSVPGYSKKSTFGTPTAKSASQKGPVTGGGRVVRTARCATSMGFDREPVRPDPGSRRPAPRRPATRAATARRASYQRPWDVAVSPRDMVGKVLEGQTSRTRTSNQFNSRWLERAASPSPTTRWRRPASSLRTARRSSPQPVGLAIRPKTAAGVRQKNIKNSKTHTITIRASYMSPESEADVKSDIKRFEKSMKEQKQSRIKNNMFRLRSGASKKARNIKMHRLMKAT